MIDFHCHILPGLDDGPSNLDESMEMARILAGAGFSTVCCTPHSITGFYDNSSARVVDAVALLQSSLDEAAIPLRLVPGTEYYLDEYLQPRLDTSLTLGKGNLILVEMPLQANAAYLAETVFMLVRRGYTPLIAHPERCALLHRRVERRTTAAPGFLEKAFALLGAAKGEKGAKHRNGPALPGAATGDCEQGLLTLLRDMGCRFQGNIGSFAGIYEERVRRKAVGFLRSGLYSCLGSDAHNSRNLAEWLDRGLREVERHVGVEKARSLLSGELQNEDGFSAPKNPSRIVLEY